jgi:putative membrane protein
MVAMNKPILFKRTVHLSEDDHSKVTHAVAEAESKTDGEIVTIVSDISDDYRETAYVWAALMALASLAAFALAQGYFLGLVSKLAGEWNHVVTPAEYVAAAGSVALTVWLVTWGALHWRPLRLALTLPFVKRAAVRARAIDLFRVGTEARTKGQTGILVYLSLTEHRAEIVADEAIASKVSGEVWGDAMLALVKHSRKGDIGAGMAEAVRQIGAILAEHFPVGDKNPNEIPDRLIEL